MANATERPCLLVLASTYPRWENDNEPGFVHELAKRLHGYFRVLVLCPHAHGAKHNEVIDGVEIIRYQYAPARMQTLVSNGGIVNNLKQNRWKYLLLPSFFLMQIWHAWVICQRERVDIVHAHWLMPQGLVAALLGFIAGRKIPFLVTSHGADLFALKSNIFIAIKRFVLNRATKVTVVSHAMLNPMAALGASGNKVSVLSMGVDMVSRFIPPKHMVRPQNQLLFVGRLVEKKGLRYLLDALPFILRGNPEIRLSVVGFGPEEKFLKAKVQSLGLERAVEFLGAFSQPELPSLYQRATLLVAPFVEAKSGDQEGLGLVLVEAIGCACPVLAGNVAAVSELLEPEWQIDVRDPQLLAERILQLLAAPATLNEQVLLLRERTFARFDWTHVAVCYANQLYEIHRQKN